MKVNRINITEYMDSDIIKISGKFIKKGIIEEDSDCVLFIPYSYDDANGQVLRLDKAVVGKIESIK